MKLALGMFVVGLVALTAPSRVVAAVEPANPYLDESPAQHDARMKWFRDARFGMFIHWGLYSQAAGEFDGKATDGAGEWIQCNLTIPASQYQRLVPRFNPERFDARAWVRTAKDAGMKYIVITTKHHDGFAIYPSKLTDWSIKSTPFARDPLKELSEACKEEGIRLCFYHSIMDWHHPDYAPRKPWNDLANPSPDFERYVQFMKGELTELLTNYGPIGIVWFDGNWENTWNYDRGVDLYKFCRALQPNIIVNNRVGQDKKGVAGSAEGQERVGDYGTPEQQIPASGFGPGVDWETCMTMNDTWGYKKQDQNWKSTQTLVRNLIDIASKGGNYLLNVGPTGEGLIPDASVDRLKAIGQWMRVNGDSIYATSAGPFKKQLAWGRCTMKAEPDGGTTLYLHVFDWPSNGELLVPGLKNRAAKACLLADPQRSIGSETTDEGLLLKLTGAAPDAISSTIAVRIDEPLHVEPVPISESPDGSIALLAADARLHGNTFKYEVGGPLDDIGFWTDANDWIDWPVRIHKPGTFTVAALIASPASGSFDVSIGGQTLHCAGPVTANYLDFKLAILGTIEIPAAGVTTLSVKPAKDGWQPMNLKSVHLIPQSPNR